MNKNSFGGDYNNDKQFNNHSPLSAFIELIKADRRVWFIGGFIVLLFVLYSFSEDRQPQYRSQPTPVPTAQRVEPSKLNGRDSTKELIMTYGYEIQGIIEKLNTTITMVNKISSDQARDRQQIQGVMESVAGRITKIEERLDRIEGKK